MGWMRTDYDCAYRAKIFTIDYREHWLEITAALEFADGAAMSPAAEGMILALVGRERPELAGCTLDCVRYYQDTRQWAITISHRSLPQVVWGEMIEREPLRKADTETQEVSQ